jgi:NAD(P)-dependent dehydrogenase (short-subunit alcohol dehydrogenase family)
MTQRRVILVTGAASGIGAAVCRRMAGPGTALLLHTRRNIEGLQAVAAEARSAGAQVETAIGDLAEPDVAVTVVQAAVSAFGGLDVLVSNAGFADRTPFATLTDAALRASTEAIQGAFFRLVTAALSALKASPAGRVIGVSSFVRCPPRHPTLGPRRPDRSDSPAADRPAGGCGRRGRLSGVTRSWLRDRAGDPCGWRIGDLRTSMWLRRNTDQGSAGMAPRHSPSELSFATRRIFFVFPNNGSILYMRATIASLDRCSAVTLYVLPSWGL